MAAKNTKRGATPTGRVGGNPEGRRPMLVTFKRKDERRDTSTDKLELVQRVQGARMRYFDAAELRSNNAGIPAGVPDQIVGFDVNLYEAPIVCTHLTEAEVDALRDNPNVAAVEEDGMAYALPLAQPLVLEGQPSVQAETVPLGVQQIKSIPGWGCSRGKGIKVAVLDTGIDWQHPDLAENVKGAVSFINGESAMDGNSHGTHCAGTIAAGLNGVGVVGVAPDASLYAVKVLSNAGSGAFSGIIAGIDWCIKNKINIISMSLGGPSNSVALEAICNAAVSAGLLVIAAAGNNGGEVGFPGAYKNVIAVSAIDASNQLAPWSSRGPQIELCAPGVQVLSTIPGGGYATKSGTSMACPHVAGAAAVVWGAHRFATNTQIWNLLAASADNLGNPGWDPHYGYGRVDVEQAALAMTPAPAAALKP